MWVIRVDYDTGGSDADVIGPFDSKQKAKDFLTEWLGSNHWADIELAPSNPDGTPNHRAITWSKRQVIEYYEARR